MRYLSTDDAESAICSHLVVVGELDDEVIVLRSVADHRLGPLSIVGPVAGGGAALLKLLMP